MIPKNEDAKIKIFKKVGQIRKRYYWEKIYELINMMTLNNNIMNKF